MKPNCLYFYIDDSGSRDPDHRPAKATNSIDWFALGGVLIEEHNKETAKHLITELRKRWPQVEGAPLHSYDIRNASRSFRWLADEQLKNTFLADLSNLMIGLPAHAMACVVHRPGYNNRYRDKYGHARWPLCKTAFMIGVERAAKLARHKGLKLRVSVERSDKRTEERLRGYYEEMRAEGLPFDDVASSNHAPLKASELRETLQEFRVKTKSSLIMQVADLALWPVCKGGYDPNHLPFKLMRDNGKLADALCISGSGLKGIKYSCFD